MMTLGLHHLGALEVDPITFVTLAADAGCQEVSMFFQPISPQGNTPLVTPDNSTALANRLRETGVRLANVECFMLTPQTQVEHFRPALELGASLGARSATALLYDSDEARVRDNLSQLCDMAASLQLNIGIEFLALTPAWNTLQQAAALATTLAKPNLRLGLDLLHLVRSGGSPADIQTLPAGLVGYAQLCDGADLRVTQDYVEEAAVHRLAPGDGCFPIQEFLVSLPPGTPLEIEVPQRATQPALERITHIVSSTRRQLQLAGLE